MAAGHSIGRRFWQTKVVGLVLVVMSLTNILLVAGAMATIRQRPSPVTITAAQVDAAHWLGQHLSECHAGFQAYRRRVLITNPFYS